MRVLITGGAGFIGSHLADHYVNAGHTVTLLDNFSTGSKTNIAHLDGKVTIVDGDIRNVELVDHLTKDADLVLHMAAALGVNTILESPLESMSTNITGSEVVLNAAAKHNKRIIIASTSEIYGKNTKQPLSETDDRVIGTPQKLRWTYSDAKALEEATAHFLFLTKQLRVTTIRFFNTVGPRQSGSYGMVLPRFVKAAVSDQPLTVYGDGTQTRSFCFVDDHIKIAYKLAKSATGIYNIGNDSQITILELTKKIFEVYEVDKEIEFKEGWAHDTKRRKPSLVKLKNIIGDYQYISLQNGLKILKNGRN